MKNVKLLLNIDNTNTILKMFFVRTKLLFTIEENSVCVLITECHFLSLSTL